MKFFSKHSYQLINWFRTNIFLTLIIIINHYIFITYIEEILLLYTEFITNFEETYFTLKEIIKINDFIADAEFSKSWQISFLNPASLGLESIFIFHNDLWLILGTIFFTIACVGIETIIHFNVKNQIKKAKNVKLIELMWTLLPIIIVLLILLPSLSLMSSLNISPIEVLDLPSLSVKITGNQWFWQYEVDLSGILDYLDLSPQFLEKYSETLSKPIKVDAYMLPTIDLNLGELRGLAATNKLTVPVGVELQIYGNSKDVIHSWTVNGFDIKMDVIPGRVNSASINLLNTGRYYGLCSEVCGTEHAFMPVEVEVVDIPKYSEWIEKLLNRRARYSGIKGFFRYLLGDYGHHTYPFTGYGKPLPDSSFTKEWNAKLYESQAKILQRHRLWNELLENFGAEVDHDESHLMFKPSYLISEYTPDSIPYTGEPHQQALRVTKELFFDHQEEVFKILYSAHWARPKVGNDPFFDYLQTTVRPINAYHLPFPWKWYHLRPIEPNYISHEYSLSLPSGMSFVGCKNQWYGPNFTSWDNAEGNIWYFDWDSSSLWIDGTEYQILMEFPTDFRTLNGRNDHWQWAVLQFSDPVLPGLPSESNLPNEQVLPVLPEAYFDSSNDNCSLINFKRELGYRFLTKKLRTWLTPETQTVLVQGFNGQIKDTGVPIDEIWCAKFKFVSLPPLKGIIRNYLTNL